MQPVPAGDGWPVAAQPAFLVDPPEPALVADRVPPAALVLLWVGVLVDAVLSAVPDPASWTYGEMRTVWFVADGLYFVALGGVGLLGRRRGLAPGGVVAWVAGGLVLLVVDAFFPDLARAFAWSAGEANTFYRVALALAVTLFAVAWFAVRRSTGVRYAFLPVVFVVALGWVWGVEAALQHGSVSGVVYRVESAVLFPGATALMALIVFLSGKVRGAAASAPSPGWPVQQQWVVQQHGPAQQQWPVPPGPYAAQPAAPWGYGQYAPPSQRTNTLAVVALVLGVVGVSLGGVICGHLALSQIRRTGEAGRGMAIAGLVLGYLWIAVVVILLIVAASLASSSTY
jgi:Domain of unknown function (DUF4190)